MVLTSNEKNIYILVMILRGIIVDITLVILMFSEMQVFLQRCLFCVFLET